MARIGPNQVSKGVQDAMSNWLADRPVTLPDNIEAGIAKAFDWWLDANRDRIIDLIAEKVSERMSREANP